ncbi:NFX1-type zinc finger-containing protein 1 [Toxocara canis]|uniref:NFX1-type zinc finger-containing protein 1 n=1 Tax=Toxocara canis TaxID=6265 RepID=A0A0B2V439_TOXCA|nr:NFX1-type zinc finger-containing protein 1 [Toxocara canis]
MCCGGSPADRDFSRRKCSEECLFCVQICANKCVHRACSYLCWQPCEVKPCKHKCTKKLRCGHSCAGLCGEMCPDLCNICDAARWKELFRNSGHSSSILQFQSCGCFLLVENVDAAIAMQQRSKEFLKCPKCLSKLTVKSCFRYAAQLKREALGVEKGKFLAAAVDLDRCSKAKANIIRWLATEVKDLKKCLNMTSPAKRGLLLLLTDAVDSIRIGMAKSNFNEVTASSWKRLLPDLSDLCAISRRIATTKFCSNPSRHLPCLRSIFTQYFGKSQNVHSAIDGQLSLLTGFMRQTIMEVPSTLIPSIACGVRVIFVKYQVSVMVREISKRATDLTKTQMNEIKMVIDKALTPAEESQQKKAVAELMRKFREIYDAFDMTHMLWAELQCITDPMLADPMLGT